MSDRERYWRRKVAELESSGMSRAAFCRRHRIHYQTMTYWIKRFRDDGIRSSDEEGFRSRHRGDARFVEVPVSAVGGSAMNALAVKAPAMNALAVKAPAVYEVHLGGGRSIRVGGDFESEALVRLIRTVESC